MSVDITCAECVERLPEYVVGLGDTEERERIERHLSTCERCRAQLTLWQAIGEALEQDIATVPPDTRAIEGWSRLVAQLPVSRGRSSSNSAFSASGDQPVGRDRLRTVELDDEPAHYPEQRFQSSTNRPARRWMAPVGVIAALLIVALGAMLFASHTSRRSMPGPGGATPGPANVQPGPPLPQGVTMTSVTLAAPGEYWATGDVVNNATGQPDKTVVLRFTNGKWLQVGDAPMSGHLNGIAMVSATEGWAWGADFNNANIILHINGGSWQRVTLSGVNPQATPQFIRMRSATDGWLVILNPKDATGNTTPSSLLRYVNGTWRVVQSSLPYYGDIAPVGPDEAWVLGSDAESQLIVHVKSGEAIVTLRLPASYNDGDIGLEHLRVFAPDDVWATGVRYSTSPGGTKEAWTPVVYHYDGASWESFDTHAPAGVQQEQVVSASDMWATHCVKTSVFPNQHELSECRIQTFFQLGGGVWREVPLPYPDLNQFVVIADASTATDVWAFGGYSVWTPNANGTGWSGGTYPVLLHYLNGAWTQYGR